MLYLSLSLLLRKFSINKPQSTRQVAGGVNAAKSEQNKGGLSWSIGYVSLFAPSGLGVREAVLVAILSVAYVPEQIVFYVTLNRLIWVVVGEVVLGLIATTSPQANTETRLSPSDV